MLCTKLVKRAALLCTQGMFGAQLDVNAVHTKLWKAHVRPSPSVVHMSCAYCWWPNPRTPYLDVAQEFHRICDGKCKLPVFPMTMKTQNPNQTPSCAMPCLTPTPTLTLLGTCRVRTDNGLL